MDENREQVVVMEPREGVDPEVVNAQVRSAIHQAVSMGELERLMRCRNVRRCVDGLASNGRLNLTDEERQGLAEERSVFTWVGAPDVRVTLADEIIEERRLLRSTVLSRGDVVVAPRETEAEDGEGDEERAAAFGAALRFFRSRDARASDSHLELFFTCVEEYGHGAVRPEFVKGVQHVPITVRAEDLRLLHLQREQAAWAEARLLDGLNPEALLTQEVASEIAAVADQAFTEMMMDPKDRRLLDLVAVFDSRISEPEAKRVVKELRRELVAEALVVVPRRGDLRIRALVPFVDIIYRVDVPACDVDWVAIPKYFTEVELRARAEAEDWDEDFLEAVLQQKNVDNGQETGQYRWVGCGVGMQWRRAVDQDLPWYCVNYVHQKVVDEDGVPFFIDMVVHPQVNEHLGFQKVSRLDGLPVIIETRERGVIIAESRGVPEIVEQSQTVMKDALDGEGARGQLASNPPLERESDTAIPIKPGVQLYKRRGGGSAGYSFMKTPPADGGVVRLVDKVDEIVARRFFRGPNADPTMREVMIQDLMYQTAQVLTDIYRVSWQLMMAAVDPEEVSRIIGYKALAQFAKDDPHGDVDVKVDFMSSALGSKQMESLLTISERIAVADRAGRIDHSALVEIILKNFDPAMARRVVLSATDADARAVADQQSRIAAMVAGVQPEFVERQTALQTRRQVMEDWLAIPENVTKLNADPRLAKLVAEEFTYLANQEQQYQVNPGVGRAVMASESEQGT